MDPLTPGVAFAAADPATAAIEFAYEIILALAILDPATAKQWFGLFKHCAVPPPEFWSRT